MTEKEFDLLYAVHKNKSITDFSVSTVSECEKSGWIKNNKVTDKGYEALKPYKVDNAIIMAAGRSRRCMPLSNYLPKGLFEIKGDTMVERQIKQLKDAGINEIILVAGYKKEKYFEMAKKYLGLIVIENTEWEEKNNTSSIYAAKDYLKNTYICCSDNWFAHNVYREYVYDSYYAAKFSDEFINEDFAKSYDENGYIKELKRGGENGWYVIGESYWNREFSAKFKDLMIKEYYDPEMKYMLWDHFYAKHIDELKMKIMQRNEEDCKEFDTTEEIIEFYPGFKDFVEQFIAEEEMENQTIRLNYLSNYADTKSYSVVSTEQFTGRLHVNENLFKPSPKCLEVMHNASYEDVMLYDLTREDELAVEISKKEGIGTDHILIHSGSSDVIKTIMTLVLNKGDTVLISAPSWNYYKSVVELRMAKAAYYEIKPGDKAYEFDVNGLREKARTITPRIIILTTPHNPTGAFLAPRDLETVIKENPASLIIVDEAYLGFSPKKYDVVHLLHSYSNVVFSRTFSKLYGLAGVRVGYGICNPMAKQVFRLDLNPFRVNNISRKMAIAALKDKEYYDGLLKDITASRNYFIEEMNKISGVTAFESDANFVFIHFKEIDTQSLKDYLQENGYLVRLWTEGSNLAMRVTLDRIEVMEKVVSLIKEFIKK